MKTLKYLMLLLAVALALPAMAQEELKAEKATTQVKLDTEKKVGDLKVINSTSGVLSKHNAYTVKVDPDGTFVAQVEGNKSIHELVKYTNGLTEKNCYADTATYCAHGYTHMKKEVSDDALKDFVFTNEKIEASQVAQLQASDKLVETLQAK